MLSLRDTCQTFIGENEGRLQAVAEQEAKRREASKLKIDCEM
jgi:hypothetical protein